MTIETYSLVLLTIFFFLAWLPASIAKRITYGRSYLLSNRDQGNLEPMPPWGDRCLRAYENLRCYFPAFIVAVLLLNQFQISTTGTKVAAVVFALSRITHYLCYAFGWVPGRAWCWAIGLVANLYLLTVLLFV